MIGQVLGDRYEIQQQLAKKAGRRTLLAREIKTQELVVVKLLSSSGDFEWNDLKLFKREAKTLKTLSHPAIPRYLDFLELDLVIKFLVKTPVASISPLNYSMFCLRATSSNKRCSARAIAI